MVLKRFKKRVQKKASSDQEGNIILDVTELEPETDPSVQMGEVNPYQNQIQLLYEKSLLDDPDLESAHNLSKWLMEHPEFLPDPSNDQ